MTATAVVLARFFARGIPQPQGNKTGFVVNGRAVLVEGRRGPAREQFKSWRSLVADAALEARLWGAPDDGPLHGSLVFVFPRPKGHFGKKGLLDRFATAAKTGRPDSDKLARAIFDAMKGIVYVDDSQIVGTDVRKRYGPEPGAHVCIARACACGDRLDLCAEHSAQ